MTKLRLPALKHFGSILLVLLFVSVPFYALLTVWGSTILGHYTALRLYPDVLLLFGIGYGVTWLYRKENIALRSQIFGSVLFKLVCAYALLAGSLGVVAYLKHEVTGKALFYGLLVDLRFLAWLFVAPVLARSSGWQLRRWHKIILLPVAIVSAFAILQFSVLPHNFLGHFGYNKMTTITPFQTINQDSPTIRAQSTLRGANPLGAYLVIGISLLITAYTSFKQRLKPIALLLLASFALLFSFSRSAWIGALVAASIGIFLSVHSQRQRKILVGVGVGVVLIGILGFMVFQGSKGVQDAVLHVNSSSTASKTSNAGHLSALQNGLRDLIHEPLGRGPGTAGPASAYNASFGNRNSENYYLQIGQELGWVGLVLFVSINAVVLLELWRRRLSPLARGLFVSGIGLILVNLLSFAWSDPSLAYIWWGLAGIALIEPVTQAVDSLRIVKAKT